MGEKFQGREKKIEEGEKDRDRERQGVESPKKGFNGRDVEENARKKLSYTSRSTKVPPIFPT